MADFESFRWNFSLSTNLIIGRSEVFKEIIVYLLYIPSYLIVNLKKISYLMSFKILLRYKNYVVVVVYTI